MSQSINIGINGLGRIGRSLLKTIYKETSLKVVHINDLNSIETIAYLLKYDSTYGTSDLDITYDKKNIIINDEKISFSKEATLKKIEWQKNKTDIVIDCTGKFLSKDTLSYYLDKGVKKVIVSSPCTNADNTIVIGFNEKSYNTKKDNIISASSCTANCLIPVLSILIKNYGIDCFTITNIHPYNIDQKLLDGGNDSDLRLGRSAIPSIIPTTTGIIKTVSDIMPELKNKITGYSLRVPTPNVSLIDIVLKIKKKNVTIDDVNELFKKEAEKNYILDYNDKELVSVDYKGSKFSAIFDAFFTKKVGKDILKIGIWHDNEKGYVYRLMELSKIVASHL